MKLPRDLSGVALVKLLCKHHGYLQVNQEVSHMILQTDTPRSHRLSIAAHPALRPGTLNAILRAVADAKGIEKADILNRL